MVVRLLCVLLILALPQTASAQYLRDHAFEKTVRQMNPNCMPPVYPLETELYPMRVGKAALANCGDEALVLKYSNYIVRMGANPAVAADFADELKSDTLKCVVKAFVDAESTLNTYQKDDLKVVVDGIGTIVDWGSFVKSLPNLRSADVDTFIATLLSARDRNFDLLDFYESDLAGRAVDYVVGKRQKHLSLLQHHRDRCDYGQVWDDLENARTATDEECVYAGHRYRQREKNVREHWRAMRSILETPLGTGDDAKRTHNLLLELVDYEKDRLASFRSKYDELDRIEREVSAEASAFLDLRTQYRNYARHARQEIPQAASCGDLRDVTTALALAERVEPLCRAAFQGTSGDRLTTPEELLDLLAQTGRARSAQYWDMLDDIRAQGNACDLSARETTIRALRQALRDRPVLRFRDGTCETVIQPQVRERFDQIGASVPEHCKMTDVPREILGESVADALPLLDAAQLMSLGAPNRVVPRPDQVEGIVVGSIPVPGTSLRIWSGVRLIVTGPQPDANADPAPVNVPAIVGLTTEKARDALAEAGLVAVEAKRIPADKPELKPGFVQSAAPAPGAPVPAGSSVALTVIGPRPMIEVPSIAAAKTLADAQAILSRAGFTAGPPAAGDPAPEDKAPGSFYGTLPPGPGPYPMFTQVRPLAYAPRTAPELRPVPSVIGLEPMRARDLIALDDFFKVGTISPGDPVEEGEKPGVVQSTKPGPTTPAPRGTVVNIYVAMPLSDEADPATDVPPPPSSAPDAPPAPTTPNESAGDADWRGMWELTGIVVDRQPIGDAVLRFRIAQEEGQLMFQVFTRRDDTWKKFLRFPARVDASGVLRAEPVFLREMEAEIREKAGSGEVNKFSSMIFQALKDLEMTRSGFDCSIRLFDARAGRMAEVFGRCTRL